MNHRPARSGPGPRYFPPPVPSSTSSPPRQRRRITRAMKAPTHTSSLLAKFFVNFITRLRQKRLLIKDNEADEMVVEKIWAAYEVLVSANVTVGGLREVKEGQVVRLGVPKWVWGYVREQALEWFSCDDMEDV